ncbi:MAG TPA: radical SAM protein [Dehalococcoidia bacterium]|nr:radical SAM protein [Dehalococcoidia bacterium]
MRILCVYPALLSGWSSYVPHGNNESSYMNHGLAMITAVLKRAGHDPFLVDLRALSSWDDFERVLGQIEYDLSLMSWLSCDDAHARQAAEMMKRVRPDRLIIAGGVHLSVTESREYPNVDTVVLGEGEEHILDIVGDIESGRTPKSLYELKPVPDLDALPFVDRALFNPEMEETSPLLPLLPEPFITISAGRGCWAKCTFCAPSRDLISGNTCRIRSVGHFIDEVVLLNLRPGGIGSLMIHDDLLGSRQWMADFISQWRRYLPRIPIWCQLRADSIIRIRDYIPALAEIGLAWVSVGFESGSQRMLDWLKKGTTVEQNILASEILHENQVNIFGNYIIGLPTETQEDLEATGRMLAVIKPAFHSTSVYTSYPGSVLYNWIRDNDYWTGEHQPGSKLPHSLAVKGVDYYAIGELGATWRERYTSPLREWS